MARPRVAVATSGGLDSTALLHCTVAQGRALGVEVVALHVHHGLMPQADDWLVQVRRQALRWGAGFQALRVSGQPQPGDSIEAWAREQRYAALARMAQEQGCSAVLLAQHRRDQAETFLLQALRGAGSAGLAAMPQQAQRQGLDWLRPWLKQPRAAIEAYARRHRFRWVEDPSNADPRLARGRLRQQLWPALAAAFPDAEVTLSLAARHAHEAAQLEAEVARADLLPLLSPQGLAVAAWRELGPLRARAALRLWLHEVLPEPPPYTLLERLDVEVLQCSTARWPAPGGELRLHRGRLSWAAAVPAGAGGATERLNLSQPGRYDLPSWQGALVVERCNEGGVLPAFLEGAELRARHGGEQFQLTPGGMPRSLKKQFQAAGVPAWGRAGPLVWARRGALLFVPSLGMNAASWAAKGAPQRRLRWEPGV